MYLYSLTLQQATGVVCATNGNFVGGKTQEIVVARGKTLDLIRPDDAGKIQTLHSVDVFGAIRSLAQFRLTGSQKDYVVVGSDSGRIVILEYSKDRNCFDKVHQETFGKSGCRRIVPGQYLAVDPKGRAVMIAACEKQKLVYVLNRDTVARLTISSLSRLTSPTPSPTPSPVLTVVLTTPSLPLSSSIIPRPTKTPPARPPSMPRSILPSMSLTLASTTSPASGPNPLITGLTSSSLSRVVGTALAASLSVLRTLSSTRTRATLMYAPLSPKS
ncbi:hypothetical protein J5N97_017337 [Dioscorea zingiberensis]|uniref:RSE1/DDB1/CPSF1 first beta-propeller domain-containing protein n=1 Tax=Dioscorea zingiberensis TaxID=325984 RepID=A0A9D5CMZ3_9LILI|nr:hypothetical protein J5N97_017337 [Dioscorea zingiberensis]